jgi:cytochrome b561
MLRNSATTWGSAARIFHWLMAALIIAQGVLGKYAHELEPTPEKLNLMMWHKSIGITLLFLVSFRLLWRLANPRPVVAMATPRWERASARLSHIGLYALMFAIPLSGWLMNSAKNIPFSLYRIVPWPALIGPDKALGEVFEEWHEGLVSVLLALLVLHIAAALWHHFVKKDTVMIGMLWGSKTP